ncbi:MAG TPA: hypothetical protein VF592_03445 [Sphingomonas sp.]
MSRPIAAIALYIIALCQISSCTAAQEQSRAVQRISYQERCK